jgi:hypothetical protein
VSHSLRGSILKKDDAGYDRFDDDNNEQNEDNNQEDEE